MTEHEKTLKALDTASKALSKIHYSTHDADLYKAVGKAMYHLAQGMATVNHLIAKAVPMKTVTNIMTGQPVTIPADTPLSCDPSSETYWSM